MFGKYVWIVMVGLVVVLDGFGLCWIVDVVVDDVEMQLVDDIVQCVDVDFFYVVGVFEGFVGLV